MVKEQAKFAFELNAAIEELYNAVAEDLNAMGGYVEPHIEALPKTFECYSKISNMAYKLLKENLCFDDIFLNSLCADIPFDDFWKMWGNVLENAEKYN
jgi:hypothetical protein